MASRISMKLSRHSDIHGEGVFLATKLWSHTRPGLQATIDNIVYKHEPFDKLRKLAGASGGAMAEYLNDNYQDRHDPSECARVAVECFDRMIADFNQTGRLQESIVSS